MAVCVRLAHLAVMVLLAVTLTAPAAHAGTGGLPGADPVLLAAGLAAFPPGPIIEPSASGSSASEEAASPSASPSLRASRSPNPSASRSAPSRPTTTPTSTRVPALVTDTISLYGVICADPQRAGVIAFSHRTDAPMAASCHQAAPNELTFVVLDPMHPDTVYDRVTSGNGGYTTAVAPTGQPFVVVVQQRGHPFGVGHTSPRYLLDTDPNRRRALAVRATVYVAAAPSASPVGTTAAPVTPAGTPATDADDATITILGIVCASAPAAGQYDYRLGGAQPAPGSQACRPATDGEMEFLVLDNAEPTQLYADVLTDPGGTAVASVPVGRAFFVTEFNDDPGAGSGAAGGSEAITIPADPAQRNPLLLTVIHYVPPGAINLAPGTVMISSVACPAGSGAPGMTVLGPATTFLTHAPGTDPALPQPGTGPGCGEAAATYRIAPFGDLSAKPIVLRDGASDGALITRLPASLTRDGERAFPSYVITDAATGLSTTFDVREGAVTSVRVVLPLTTSATPGADDGSPEAADDATPGPDGSSAEASGAEPVGADPAETSAGPVRVVPTAMAPPTSESGGLSFSPTRLIWAALFAAAAVLVVLGAVVVRRNRQPGGRPRR